MNNSIYKINLELHEVGSQLTLTAKAYDTARQIRCTFTDNGRPYVITDDCFAVFTAKKPDGNILFNATHIDGNVVHYDFTVNTVNASGVLECEMRLYNGNGKLITSPRFSILVDDTVYHDGDVIESASEYTALTRLMEMVVSTLGEIPSPVLYGMAQNLSGEQKAQARENIGAVSAEDLEAKQSFLPVAKGYSKNGVAYTATDSGSGAVLPEVAAADRFEQISAVGKGRQIVFVPDMQNASVAPTLQINDGEVIPIRLRAPKNQGENDDAPDATLQVPVGALMRGVPYTMTFCGMYWLVDSMIDLHTDAATKAEVTEMISSAIGDVTTALSDMDSVIGGAQT